MPSGGNLVRDFKRNILICIQKLMPLILGKVIWALDGLSENLIIPLETSPQVDSLLEKIEIGMRFPFQAASSTS